MVGGALFEAPLRGSLHTEVLQRTPLLEQPTFTNKVSGSTRSRFANTQHGSSSIWASVIKELCFEPRHSRRSDPQTLAIQDLHSQTAPLPLDLACPLLWGAVLIFSQQKLVLNHGKASETPLSERSLPCAVIPQLCPKFSGAKHYRPSCLLV